MIYVNTKIIINSKKFRYQFIVLMGIYCFYHVILFFLMVNQLNQIILNLYFLILMLHNIQII